MCPGVGLVSIGKKKALLTGIGRMKEEVEWRECSEIQTLLLGSPIVDKFGMAYDSVRGEVLNVLGDIFTFKIIPR